MDAVFHFASSALLAYGLGERRRGWLIAAGALGLAPDIMWPLCHLPGMSLCYTIPHSLVFNIALCAIAATFNWKIAFGPLLHIFIDIFTHASSTSHLLYPFARWKPFTGLSWWSGYGLVLWASMWLLLIVAAIIAVRWKRKSMLHACKNTAS